MFKVSSHRAISLIGLLPFNAAPLRGQGFIASSLEQYNYQVGDSQLVLKNYEGFEEIDDFASVTGLAFSINGGASEDIPFDPFYGTFKRARKYDTLAEMLAERPINGTYTHTLSGTPSGTINITAPNVPYANGIPNHPVFTISGATGTWGRDPSGIGIFYFDPATTTSFTVTMNAYGATTQGPHYAYGVFIADVTSGFNYINEVSSDLVVNGETPTVPANLTLTFTRDLPLNAGDADPATFGFSAGTRFEIEGEHVNIFGLSDAGLGDGSRKVFPYQTVTAFNLVAIGDPASGLPTAGNIAVTDHAIGAQDGVNDHFFLNWETTPVDSPVDVYRSEDLTHWRAVSILNQATSYSEPVTPGSKAFFTVVPSGQTPWIYP